MIIREEYDIIEFEHSVPDDNDEDKEFIVWNANRGTMEIAFWFEGTSCPLLVVRFLRLSHSYL